MSLRCCESQFCANKPVVSENIDLLREKTGAFNDTLRMIHSGPLDDVSIESFRRVFPRKCADFS
jgi:hypothetical protein